MPPVGVVVVVFVEQTHATVARMIEVTRGAIASHTYISHFVGALCQERDKWVVVAPLLVVGDEFGSDPVTPVASGFNPVCLCECSAEDELRVDVSSDEGRGYAVWRAG